MVPVRLSALSSLARSCCHTPTAALYVLTWAGVSRACSSLNSAASSQAGPQLAAGTAQHTKQLAGTRLHL